MKDSKRLPIVKKFDALGVTFDFQHSQRGEISVRNKAGRIIQICSELDKILHSGELSMATASSLRGKLQFAETHTFGRVLASHLKHFNQRASGQLSGSYVNDDMMCEIQWVRDYIRADVPRTQAVRVYGCKPGR